MRKQFFSFIALLLVAQFVWANVDSSTPLTTYYATANGLSGNALRLALFDKIKTHTDVGYGGLGTLMQWSDTENADGEHVYDIYSTCSFTTSGPITWGNASSVGGALNREHTVPQSWFGEAAPMKADAFHVYPSDCKANNNRSSFLYGEFSGAGTSYSSNKGAETGKKGTSEWQAGVTSYTYNDQTYVATTSYTGTVYEVEDQYKGDIARSYFYMATCYADRCANWSGGAFGDACNGLGTYTAELMLKWHRLDPVSEKELIRNEVIYGNPTYNQSIKKQGNRNPFIDYPELVEYIWGDKQGVPVSITALDSPYANESPEQSGTDINVLKSNTENRKVLINHQLYIMANGQLYNLQGQIVK